jgi:hypothetical protein
MNDCSVVSPVQTGLCRSTADVVYGGYAVGKFGSGGHWYLFRNPR